VRRGQHVHTECLFFHACIAAAAGDQVDAESLVRDNPELRDKAISEALATVCDECGQAGASVEIECSTASRSKKMRLHLPCAHVRGNEIRGLGDGNYPKTVLALPQDEVGDDEADGADGEEDVDESPWWQFTSHDQAVTREQKAAARQAEAESTRGTVVTEREAQEAAAISRDAERERQERAALEEENRALRARLAARERQSELATQRAREAEEKVRRLAEQVQVLEQHATGTEGQRDPPLLVRSLEQRATDTEGQRDSPLLVSAPPAHPAAPAIKP